MRRTLAGQEQSVLAVGSDGLCTQTGVSQNTELFIKMQRLSSSVMVSSQGHELGGRDAHMLYLCDRPWLQK